MFNDFQDIFNKTASKLGIKKQLDASLICAIARKEISNRHPDLKGFIKIISFTNGILKVKTKHPIISQKLLPDLPDFIASINSKINTKIIKKITIQSN